LALDALTAAFGGDAGAAGLARQCLLAAKWARMEKGEDGTPHLVRSVTPDAAVDTVRDELRTLADAGGDPGSLPQATLTRLTKRKLVKAEAWKTYAVTKGPAFALERRKLLTDLTADMVSSGAWRDGNFKEINLNALGTLPAHGALHPLLKVRSAFRKIFTSMGFEEMDTNAWVESSFWNFDALFQPQQHPARDAHDTFFLAEPSSTPLATVPPSYAASVRAVHERGGHGSAGYDAPWKVAEAEKNLLRTHTTAVSSRMLHRLATHGFRPARLFSIDRVFRNEAIDRTHLAEFHQVEGLVCGPGLTLGDLIGTLSAFFARLGLSNLRFKPAYNPYTEPSMEIMAYSEEKGDWMEIGNSGMFRPEMLRPMGLPEGVTVIAWGLSLERPTMILYGIDNIRDLFGHRVSLAMVRSNPVCRLGL
jgi:phenylalanyl-tRNA synthetase alpha chain